MKPTAAAKSPKSTTPSSATNKPTGSPAPENKISPTSGIQTPGPGPAKYNLKPLVGHTDHDITFERMPMHTFGPRLPANRTTDGPGAGKYRLEYKNREGVPPTKAYIGRTFRLPAVGLDGPGPAKYAPPELLGERRPRFVYAKSPDFVIGKRFAQPNTASGPGPAKYMPPALIGEQRPRFVYAKSPDYVMGRRLRTIDAQVSPGPAKYYPKRDNSRAIPIVMKARRVERLGSGTPGANKYNLAGYRPGDAPPEFSMGRRLNGVARPMIVAADNC